MRKKVKVLTWTRSGLCQVKDEKKREKMAIHSVEYFLNRGCLKVSAGDTFANLDDLLRVFGLTRAMVEYDNDRGGKSIKGGVPIPGLERVSLWWPIPAIPQILAENRKKWWYNVFEGDKITEYNNSEPEYYKDRLYESQFPGCYRVVFKRYSDGDRWRYQFIGIYRLDAEATVRLKKSVWLRDTKIDEFSLKIDRIPAELPLNQQQQDFVDMPSDADIRLLAPAGTGKTKTLLYRCRKLLEGNLQIRILLVTFTKKACEELQDRLIRDVVLNKYYSRIGIYTLNSLGDRLVHARNNNVELLEEKDFGSRFRRVVSLNECSDLFRRQFENANWLETNAATLLKMVDRFKSLGFDHVKLNTLQTFADYVKALENLGAGDLLAQWMDELQGMWLLPENVDGAAKLQALYENFWLFCQSTIKTMWHEGYYTLEDQKYWGWRIIKDAGKIQGKRRYDYIMVDEFQDINPLDLNFINALRARHDATVTIVGDDDQAIFEWRGANPKYIVDPDKYFGLGFTTQIFEMNYRSPRNIVAMAKRLIDNNEVRVKKKMDAAQEINAEVIKLETSGIGEIVRAITQDARNKEHKSLVVMVRKRCHLLAVQMQLALKHIPFIASGDLNLFLSSAFRSLGDMLQLKGRITRGELSDHDSIAVALGDVLALVAEKPLSEDRHARIQRYLSRNNFSTLKEAVDCVGNMPDDIVGDELNLADAVMALVRFFAAKSVKEAIHEIGNSFSGLKKNFSRAGEDIFFADPPFDELEVLSSSYGDDFGRFKADIDQAVQQKGIVLFANNAEAVSYMNGSLPKIELTTALRTKGGQFDVVYILHANEDTWPIKHAETKAQLEAERRLFYVAITRTQKKLVFAIDKDKPPTRYLDELEDVLC